MDVTDWGFNYGSTKKREQRTISAAKENALHMQPKKYYWHI